MKKSIGRFTIIFAIIMTCMQNNGMGAASPALAAMAAAFPDINYTIISMTVTLPTVAGALSLLIYPLLVKRMKKRSILYLLIALYFVASIGPAVLCHNIGVILFFRVIMGWACVMFQLYTMDLVVDFFDGSVKDRMSGVQAAMTGVSGIIFMTAGGFLTEIQWNYCFLATLISVIFVVLAIIFLPEPDRKAKLELEKEYLGEENVQTKLPIGVFVISILAWAYWVMFFINLTNAPIILTTEGLADASEIGLMMSAATVAQVIAGILLGSFMKKVKFHIIPIGFAIGAVGMFILHSADSFGLYTVGAIIFGFTGCLICPAVTAKVTSLVPYAAGSKAVTANFLINNLGGFCSPFIFGNLGLDGRGQLFVGACCMAVLVIVSIIMNILIKPKRDYNLENAKKTNSMQAVNS